MIMVECSKFTQHQEGADKESLKPEITRFTSETREALEKDGFIIYESTGKSINDLKKEGYVIK